MGDSAKACLFPGQGSQRRGMGKELFERFPALVETAEAVLGWSVVELCLEDPGRRLKQTQFTQPALFVVDALHWLDHRQWAPEPDFLAGHSLGEYAALFAAGCFDFETGLHLVRKRGELMARITDGGMAAVLGLEVGAIRGVLREQGAPVDIANLNLPEQTVLAGPKTALEALIEPMEKAGAQRCLVLPVSGPFHSRYMEPAARAFADFLRAFQFEAPRLAVIANTTARPYEADAVAETLVEQIRSPVRWAETLGFLRRQGVEEVEELGPGTVLTKMWGQFPAEAPEAKTSDTDPARNSVVGPTPVVRSLGPQSSAQSLGSADFRRDHGLRAAYVVGGSTPGVRTVELVSRAAAGGLLAFLDAFEPSPSSALDALVESRGSAGGWGIALDGEEHRERLPGLVDLGELVDLALSKGVRRAEVRGFRRIEPELLRFRFASEHHRLLVLVDGPATAERFLSPAPDALLDRLEAEGRLTSEAASRARRTPVASELCAVPSPGSGLGLDSLLPTLLRLRDRLAPGVRLGAGGALGSPEAVACAFFLGADFVRTGAINASARRSGYSAAVRRRLAELEPGQTAEAPSAVGFELGARNRVLKQGSLFAARAERLYELYRACDPAEGLASEDAARLEPWLGPLEGVGSKAELAERFRRYLFDTRQRAFELGLGADGPLPADLHLPCDESMAAFNAAVVGHPLADPAARDIVDMADFLLMGAAELFAR